MAAFYFVATVWSITNQTKMTVQCQYAPCMYFEAVHAV